MTEQLAREADPETLARRQLKADGRECFVWFCREPDPRFPVIWKCPAGHRFTLWYCAGHGGPMMSQALEAARKGAGLGCENCPDVVLMEPATEGR